jgi:hypothetical protein
MAVSHGPEPTGPAFDIVLLLHIGCVLIAIVTVVISAAQAGRLRGLGLADPSRDPDLWAESPPPAELLRYYRPGPNYAGRVIWGVPIFGFILLGLSHDYYRFSQAWILTGLAIFIVVALLGEVLLWPTERRLQRLVQVSISEAAGPSVAADGASAPLSMLGPTALIIALSFVMVVLMLVATVVMVAQPG